jgi:hypothetical protein
VSFNGDYRSMAEAVGEATHHTGWVAGEDFDPSDPEEMETMRLVWDRERHDKIARLEAENARLRALLATDDDD